MKKPFTSSAHPRGPLRKSIPCELHLPKIKSCPECGQEAIEWICSDYRTEMGFRINDLERWHCSACGAEFFDADAMTRVIKEGSLANRTGRRTAIRKTPEPKNA